VKKSKGKARPPATGKQARDNTNKAKAPTPRNLTPQLCDRLRRDLLKACQAVAKTHGLVVEGGDLSDIDLRHGFDIGFRVGIPMEDGALYSTDKAMFEVLAQHFGLEASDHGRTFKARGEVFRIIAIKRARHSAFP